jgi:hypothetical protein
LRPLERLVEFRGDSLAGFQEWKRMVVARQISGVAVHATRLVAAMNVLGVTHIATYNKGDFKRFQTITAFQPDEVLSS